MLMEAGGIQDFSIRIDSGETSIMTYYARQLYTWLKDRDLHPSLKQRATYTNYPGEISADVNGIKVHCYCTKEELKELEGAESETL